MRRAIGIALLVILNTIIYLPQNLYAQTVQQTEEEILALMLEHQEEKARLKQSNSNLGTALTNLKNLNAQLEAKAEEFYLKAQNLEQKEKEILALMLEHQEEKAALEKQNQDLLTETVCLKQSNSNLGTALTNLKNLNAQLEAKAEEFYLKAQNLEQKEKDFQGLSKAVEGLNKERLALKEENEELGQRIVSLESILQNERAILYEKLGTAYTQAKLFDLAIDAYKNSLNFNPSNAHIHYNLGLLYKHSKNDTEKSVYHLKKYLELNPKAENRKEVEYLIKMLTTE